MALTAALGCLPKAAASDHIGLHQTLSMGYEQIFGCILLLLIFGALWHFWLSAIFRRCCGTVLKADRLRALPSYSHLKKLCSNICQHKYRSNIFNVQSRRAIRKWRHCRGKITVGPVISKTSLLEANLTQGRRLETDRLRVLPSKTNLKADGAQGRSAESTDPARKRHRKSSTNSFLYKNCRITTSPI